jgi:hypothetical protein
MSFDPRDYLLPSASQFRDHPDSIAERVFRKFVSSLPHRDAPRTKPQTPWWPTFTPQPPVAIVHCPNDPYWRDWDMFRRDYFFAMLPSGELAVCTRARNLHPRAHRCRVPLLWELGATAVPPPRPLPASGIPPLVPHAERHMHAETRIDHHLVHIDVVSLTKYSPGRSVDECRVFVDGTLAGRGGKCGSSIGVGGYSLPAVALVDVGVAVTVDLITDEHGPVVELWDVHDDESRAIRCDT